MREGGGGNHYISMGSGCTDKRGLVFRFCLEVGGRGFIVNNMVRNSHILSGKGLMSVCRWDGKLPQPGTGGYHKSIVFGKK